MVRRLSLLLLSASLCTGAFARTMPPELESALREFRADGPRGWAFTQTSRSGKHTLVEQFDPIIRAPFSWTLLSKDDRAPTEAELKEYRREAAFRSNTGSANVKNQIVNETLELVAETPTSADYRFQLHPLVKADRTSAFMSATFRLHKPTSTIVRVELSNREPFSPSFGVRIQELRTVMDYSTPGAGQPSLLQSVRIHLRGRAFWIHSLDEDMEIHYSDHRFAGKTLPQPDSPSPSPTPALTPSENAD